MDLHDLSFLSVGACDSSFNSAVSSPLSPRSLGGNLRKKRVVAAYVSEKSLSGLILAAEICKPLQLWLGFYDSFTVSSGGMVFVNRVQFCQYFPSKPANYLSL